MDAARQTDASRLALKVLDRSLEAVQNRLSFSSYSTSHVQRIVAGGLGSEVALARGVKQVLAKYSQFLLERL
jgi:hypothetical protein